MAMYAQWHEEIFPGAAEYDLSVRFRYKEGVLRLNVQSETLEKIFNDLAIKCCELQGVDESQKTFLVNGKMRVYRLGVKLPFSFPTEMGQVLGTPFINGKVNFSWMTAVNLREGLEFSWNLPWNKEQEADYFAKLKEGVLMLAEQYLAARDTTIRLKILEESRR